MNNVQVSAQKVNNVSCVDIKEDIIYKMNGENVLGLQTFFYNTGYLNSEPTGYFGNDTLNAVKKFQKANSISSIGNVGPATRAVIRNQTCNASGTIIISVNNNKATSTKAIINKPAVSSAVTQETLQSPQCPSNSIYNSSSNTCVCDIGYTANVYVCTKKILTTNSTSDQNTNLCQSNAS